MINADTLAGHDADAEQIPSFPGKMCNGFDHGVVHVFIRPELNRLIIAIIIHHPLIPHLAFFSHENIKERIDDAVLQFIQPAGFLFAAGLVKIRGIQHQPQFRPPLVNILVFEVLGVGQHVHLTENCIGCGNKIICTAGNDGSPSAAGNVRKTNMVTGTKAAEEKCDPKRKRIRQIGCKFVPQLAQVGRVEPEGQRLLFHDEKVGFETVGDHQQTAAVHGTADVVQPAVPGIVSFDHCLCF